MGYAFNVGNADRTADAIEAAEEAVRSLDRAGLAADATRCRYLLWKLYRRSYEHRRDALAVLDDLGSATAVPAGLPPLEVLLEEAAELHHDAEAAGPLLATAGRHRGRPAGELRTLQKALSACAGSTVDDRLRAAIARADELIAAHGDLPVAEVARLDLAVTRLQGSGGVDRAARAVAGLRRAGLDEEWARAATVHARLLLGAGRAAEAEQQSREVLAAVGEDASWSAALVTAKALLAQDRAGDAAAFMAGHGIDEDDLDDDDYDD